MALTLGSCAQLATASPHAKVIGGKLATGSPVGTATVAIIASSAKSPWAGHTCGGVLVAPQLVLTARHCVDDAPYLTLPRDYDVVLGSGADFTLSKTSWAGTARTRVLSIHRTGGPYLGAWNRGADLALLRLEGALPGSTTMAIAHPGDEAWWGSTAPRATGVSVYGWGATKDANDRTGAGPSGFPTQLQTAELPTVTSDVCSANAEFPAITRHYICAGATSHGSGGVHTGCIGDSGGPLVATDPAAAPGDPAAALKVVGIVSFGEHGECAADYGRYVRVADYAGWIDAFIAASTAVPSGATPPVLAKSSFVKGRTKLGFRVRGGVSRQIMTLFDTPFGATIEGARSSDAATIAVSLPPTRSGVIVARFRSIDAAGDESVSSDKVRVKTARDRLAPHMGKVSARSIGHGMWKLSWVRPVDNDRVVAVTVERRKVGSKRWVYTDAYECTACWTSRSAHVQLSSYEVAGAGRWQWRMTPIDRALNRGKSVLAK